MSTKHKKHGKKHQQKQKQKQEDDDGVAWWVKEFSPDSVDDEVDPWSDDPWSTAKAETTSAPAKKSSGGKRPALTVQTNLKTATRSPVSPRSPGSGTAFENSDPFFELAVNRMAAVNSPPCSPLARDMAPDSGNPFADSDDEEDEQEGSDEDGVSEASSGSDSESESEDEEDDEEQRKLEAKQRMKQKRAKAKAAAAAAKAEAAKPKAKVYKPSAAATKNPDKYVDVSVEATKWMKNGSPFLKYGRSGYPHWRMCRLTNDNTAIQWFSPVKRGYETTVRLRDINDVVLGQHTPVFQRFPSPALNNMSFSILYAHRTKSVDLVANDPNDFLIWVKGLQALISILRREGVAKIARIKKMTLRLPVRRGKRTAAWIMAAAGHKPDAKLDDELKPWLEKRNKGQSARAVAGKKKAKMPVHVRDAHHKMEKKYQKVRLRVMSDRLLTHPLYDSMVLHLTRAEQSIRKSLGWMKQMELEAADDEVWRAEVDLDALDAMVTSLKHM